ncbi:hypothetical protein KKG45_01710 [bacterium]|nr:hypothetical protein [bacterium]MBU1071942.1 hypothetical protein [bacterium]MBU1677190.1 hypothetical protein [bacterium]
MKARLTILLAVAIMASLPFAAQAQQLFDFLGQTGLPGGVGGALTLHGVVNDPAPATTPIPLDFDTYEYTLVVTGLVLDVDGNPQQYSGGAIAIYEDAATVADFAAPGTFTDGTAVLTGVVTTLDRTMFTATLGTVFGSVDWTGGSMVGLIGLQDLVDWPFFSGVNALASQVAPGYDEAWDGKVEPHDPIVDNEGMGWGELKRRF